VEETFLNEFVINNAFEIIKCDNPGKDCRPLPPPGAKYGWNAVP